MEQNIAGELDTVIILQCQDRTHATGFASNEMLRRWGCSAVVIWKTIDVDKQIVVLGGAEEKRDVFLKTVDSFQL